MDFRESLEFLYGLQRFGIKLGLDNTRTLLERAGLPQQNYPCVQVAGTNGKGSVCAFLAAILQQAGLRVGLFTSPHLVSFTERIRIDGQEIGEAEIATLTAELRPLAKGIPVTFFEFTTVLALRAFADHQVDIAILETGMGGRLDATNAVDPLLGIITPISFDHQEHLGATLPAIAAEKGGIIKPGTPVIIGLQPAAALAVLQQQAEFCHAPTTISGRDFTVEIAATGEFSYNNQDKTILSHLRSNLHGAHQPQNAALAITAALLLRKNGWQISDTAIRAGLGRTQWPGRLEWWGNDRKLLLDGAHNTDGARALADYLASLKIRGIHWLVGVKDDKSYREMLSVILPLTTTVHAVALPEIASVAPTELTALALAAHIPAQTHQDVATGLQAALSLCKTDEIVLIAGSLYLVGTVRGLLLDHEESP